MARFSGGWIKVHRNLAEKEITDNPILFSVWMYLLLIANYKESKIIWAGKQRVLEPGQCLISFRELSVRWDCSTRTISKYLHFLHDTGRIVLETETHGTVITICNWKEYQVTEQEEETRSKHEVNTEETRSKHEVNNSEEEVPSKKERRKERKNTYVGIHIVDYPREFQDVWVKYGRPGSKKAALEVWKKLNLSEVEVAMLHRSIDRYVQNNPDPRYRKHLCRYLVDDWREVEPVLETSNEKASWIQDLGSETDPRDERKAANG